MNFYNDSDPRVCAWLRELIAAGELPAGVVDDRSIADVRADELREFDQCHFFAGIGGWPLALRWAGLEGVKGIWTGSCPCQPLSSAGKRKGHADERHLWPAFYELIAECRPAIVFGEQVASKDGREWFAGVRADLEELGYACGAADLCAASVGAPHIRQRLFFVADADLSGRNQRSRSGQQSVCNQDGGAFGAVADATGRGCGVGGDATRARGGGHAERPGWSGYAVVNCRDGKARRFEPESFPLAHGVSGRVGLLRGYGNAIVPQVAAEFVRAAMEAMFMHGVPQERAGVEAPVGGRGRLSPTNRRQP